MYFFVAFCSSQIWLFGYKLNDTVCVFTRDSVYTLSGEREIQFLKPIEDRVDTDTNEPTIKLFVFDWVS